MESYNSHITIVAAHMLLIVYVSSIASIEWLNIIRYCQDAALFYSYSLRGPLRFKIL